MRTQRVATGGMRRLAAGVAMVAAFGVIAGPAAAATITVTGTADETTNDGAISLPEAIQAIDTGADFGDVTHTGAAYGTNDTIILPANVNPYLGSDLFLSVPVTITGAGVGKTTVQGDSSTSHVFEVTASGAVAISGLTITGGHESSGESGGGIDNESADLTLDHVSVRGNTVLGRGGVTDPGGLGGGIYTAGTSTLTVTDSTISGNTAGGLQGATGQDGGGGLYATGAGNVTITGSTISGNTAAGPAGNPGAGGGIFEETSGVFTITNSTITGNVSGGNGDDGYAGGIDADYGSSPMTMINTTLSGNTAGGGGGIGYGGNLEDSNTIAKNSIIANGMTPGSTGSENCYNAQTSLGYNIEDRNQCGLNGPHDLHNTNPMLGPLANNGGPTMTLALMPGSPAIDSVPVSACLDAGSNPLLTDQRGVMRPIGAGCDAGAYEAAPAAATTGALTAIGITAATLRGTAINPDALPGTAYFQYGQTTAYGSQTASQPVVAETPGAAVTAMLGGLHQATAYDARLVVTNAFGTVYGANETFTTLKSPSPPAITAARQSHKTWREGKGKHKRLPIGTTFSFVLNEPATVTLNFIRSHKAVGTLTLTADAGPNKVRFAGRISRHRKLKPGPYKLQLAATNAAGEHSAPVALKFTIKPS